MNTLESLRVKGRPQGPADCGGSACCKRKESSRSWGTVETTVEKLWRLTPLICSSAPTPPFTPHPSPPHPKCWDYQHDHQGLLSTWKYKVQLLNQRALLIHQKTQEAGLHFVIYLYKDFFWMGPISIWLSEVMGLPITNLQQLIARTISVSYGIHSVSLYARREEHMNDCLGSLSTAHLLWAGRGRRFPNYSWSNWVNMRWANTTQCGNSGLTFQRRWRVKGGKNFAYYTGIWSASHTCFWHVLFRIWQVSQGTRVS